jgi:bacterioferritin
MRDTVRPIDSRKNGAPLSDVETLRNRARKHIEQGAVTDGYRADRETVLRLLNDALATEIVCVLRYKRHYFMATGIHAQSVAAEFLEHAGEEQSHADLLAERIVQLGGEPNFDPDQLSARSHAQYVEGKDLTDMVRENLVAERIAIDSYAEMIRYLGRDDPTTRRMLEGILAAEEEHAEDLTSLLRNQSQSMRSEVVPNRAGKPNMIMGAGH